MYHALDDDDFDEDALPSFGGPTITDDDLNGSADKGKQRAPPEQLAPPGTSGQSTSAGLSGNIGSSPNPQRQQAGSVRTVGGVKVETRFVWFFVKHLCLF